MILPSDASADQSNCPPDYYRRSNGMLHQIPAEHPPETPQIDATDLVAVKAMVWSKLVQTAAVMPSNDKCLPILKELLDRIDGKAMQRIQASVAVASFDVTEHKAKVRAEAQAMLERAAKSISGNEVVKIEQQTDKPL